MLAPIETPRLELRPLVPAHLLVLIGEPERFAEVAGVAMAPGLRDFYVSDEVSPDWLAALREASDSNPWRHGFFVVECADRRVIGSVGFKGPPDDEGVVEVAYGIVPLYEGRGFATEAAAAAVTFAFGFPEVSLVRAHTLPDGAASGRVLAKNGFRLVGEVDDPEDGRVKRWERGRDL